MNDKKTDGETFVKHAQKKTQVPDPSMQMRAHRFQDLFEQAALGIIYIDATGNWLEMNQTFVDMLGYTYDELSLMALTDIVTSEDRLLLQRNLQQLFFRNISTYVCNLHYICKDGSIYLAHVTLTVSPASTAPVSYIIGFVADRSIHGHFLDKNVEEVDSLDRGRDRKFTDLPEPDPYSITDMHSKGLPDVLEVAPILEGQTQSVLRGLLAIAEALVRFPDSAQNVQFGEQELATLACDVLNCQHIGIYVFHEGDERLRPLVTIGTSEDRPFWWLANQQASLLLEDACPPSVINRLYRDSVIILDMNDLAENKDFVVGEAQTIVVASMNIGERFMGVLMVDHGSTPHRYKKDELMLINTVANLSALMVERQRLWHEHTEAIGREVALREANRHMEDFLGVASHELRTPLTTIKANTQLAIRRLKNVKQISPGLSDEILQRIDAANGMLERVERQIGVLNRLVGDMLDISRIQSGRLQLTIGPEPCDLVELVREVVQEQHQSVSKRIINVQVPEPISALVLVDRDRIEQVITNYLTNALKYSETPTPIDVVLSIIEDSETGKKEVQVAVHDQGQGLSSEDQKLVWECFYRSPHVHVLSGSGVGLGLGLHISKTLVEQHNGHWGVNSISGMGSIFWFSLPLWTKHDQ